MTASSRLMRPSLFILSVLVVSACAGLNNSHQSSAPAPAEIAFLPDENAGPVLLTDTSEAARIDPGIVIPPDTSVDAKMHVITPPEDVDPEMIIPDIGNDTDLPREDK